MITTILFDLDGTLLPMNMKEFIDVYFGHLAHKMAKYGYDPKELISSVWQGTKRMIKNDGEKTNEEVFWEYFNCKYSQEGKEEIFLDYYNNEFDNAKEACHFNELVPKVITKAKEKFRIVLATNPIFPDVATRKRTKWAGLSVDDFIYYTTYENSHYSKPNLKYYEELLSKINVKPEECLMVGNDVDEDMIVEEMGMSTFLITDYMLNNSNKDISKYNKGSFEDLISYLEQLKVA